jgi:hypothetical protein
MFLKPISKFSLIIKQIILAFTYILIKLLQLKFTKTKAINKVSILNLIILKDSYIFTLLQINLILIKFYRNMNNLINRIHLWLCINIILAIQLTFQML